MHSKFQNRANRRRIIEPNNCRCCPPYLTAQKALMLATILSNIFFIFFQKVENKGILVVDYVVVIKKDVKK